MKIAITDSRKLSEIRDQFHKQFPYLKLEFFSRPHEISDLSRMKFIIDHEKTVGECRKIHEDGVIEATGNEKVWQLEQEFQKHGLPVQVFRKGHDTWLETIQTDWWTLNQQNKEGEDSMNSVNFKTNHAELDNFDFNNI
jgi:hypothetical protein